MADKYIFSFFSQKIKLHISCQSSAMETIHMKYQVLFAWKNNKIYIRGEFNKFVELGV